MSGSILLVPSQARTITLDVRPGQAAAAAWPNKNSADQLDYWVDCTGLLLDGTDADSETSIGAVALTTLSGDANLVQIVPTGFTSPAIAQLGMVMWVLGGGTPGALYQLLLTVLISGNPARTYTRQITLAITTAPPGNNPMGQQASLLLQNVDISQALVTSTGGGSPQSLGAWMAEIGTGANAGAVAAIAQDGVRTGAATLNAVGINAATAPPLRHAISVITAGTNGVRMPAYAEVDPTPSPPATNVVERKVINATIVTQQFYPPPGLAWGGGTPNVPAPLGAGYSATGYAFPDGTCFVVLS